MAASKKRWKRIYQESNPFKLPQTIRQKLATCSDASDPDAPPRIAYLWIYLDDARRIGEPKPDSEKLNCDGWLNVVDEAAALGAHFLVISTSNPFESCLEFIKLCQWAESAHDMTVGIHIYGSLDADIDVKGLDPLDRKKTKIFVDSKDTETFAAVHDMGFDVCAADCTAEETQRPCDLPSTMTCVAPEGSLYTCGLVLGESTYRLGDVNQEKLDSVMEDESVPHTIPVGVPDKPRRCDACPPLMVKRLESTGR